MINLIRFLKQLVFCTVFSLHWKIFDIFSFSHFLLVDAHFWNQYRNTIGFLYLFTRISDKSVLFLKNSYFFSFVVPTISKLLYYHILYPILNNDHTKRKCLEKERKKNFWRNFLAQFLKKLVKKVFYFTVFSFKLWFSIC